MDSRDSLPMHRPDADLVRTLSAAQVRHDETAQMLMQVASLHLQAGLELQRRIDAARGSIESLQGPTV
jgi:hypothetical protein